MKTAAPKIYWVTGASSGIGEALALYLAAQGHQVAISARSADKLQVLAAAHTGLFPYPLDVTDKPALEATINRIFAELGSIDVAVLNAGTYIPDYVQRFDTAALEAQFQVNVIAVMNTVGFLIPLMRRKEDRPHGGRIALMSSVAGYRGLPHATGYGGTKAAIINMAESMKVGCDTLGLTMQVISPAFVKTPLTDKNPFPMPFLMPVDQAAKKIAAGLESNRFEIAFPWPMKIIMKIIGWLPYSLLFPILRRLN